ncbi:MAG: lipoyl(octanoyl) transferase [Phycisphaerales bacterium]|nr:lipoyl(octanoyl) transferase [Phycisphaerales bacterium]
MESLHQDGLIEVVDLGRISYADAYAIQRAAHERVVSARPAIGSAICADQPAGILYLLEHVPAVVTVSRRLDAKKNLLASTEALAALGVQCVETDRGGDVTWHGPGQIVVYLILDLNRLGLRVHGYLRLLEGAVIETLLHFGVVGVRDSTATGVWVGGSAGTTRKICAMGVRLSRWVSMHGIALNVNPDLKQFGLIVPCGLVGRGVTSLAHELGDRAPSLAAVKSVLALRLIEAVSRAAQEAVPAPRSATETH